MGIIEATHIEVCWGKKSVFDKPYVTYQTQGQKRIYMSAFISCLMEGQRVLLGDLWVGQPASFLTAGVLSILNNSGLFCLV